MRKKRRAEALFAAILLTVLTVLLAAGCGGNRPDPPLQGEPAAQSGSSLQGEPAAQSDPSLQGEPAAQSGSSLQGEPAAQSDPALSADPVIIEADVEEPREGCIFLEVKGSFEEPDREKILGRLNEIRLEACREGVMNPSTGEPLSEADYVPLVWSADLERTARLRAAEASVVEDHVRPNGLDCFTVEYEGRRANYETLAWGYGTIASSVDGWYSEKEAYTEETGGVASHYVALITPENTAVGAAAFTPADGTRDACAAELAMSAEEAGPAGDSGGSGPFGICIQIIEVKEELFRQLQ